MKRVALVSAFLTCVVGSVACAWWSFRRPIEAGELVADMGRWIVSFLACLIAAITPCALALATDNANLEDVERRAIAYRLENTKQGYVRFRVMNEVGTQPAEFVYETTFDATRIRQVRRARMLGKQEWGQPTGTVVTPKEYIRDPHPKTVVERMKQPSIPKKAFEDLEVLNPRLLGMDLNGTARLTQSQLTCVMINPSARTGTKVTKERRGDVDTVRLDYKTKGDGADAVVWIAPDQGHGVVGAEYRIPGKQIVTKIDCQLKLFGNTWYPSRLEKTITIKGVERRRQIVVVEEAKFGGQIDQSAFTIGGLGLLPGRQVVDQTSGQPILRAWDGKQLVDPADVPRAKPAATASTWPRVILVSVSLGLALLACMFGWRLYNSPSRGMAESR